VLLDNERLCVPRDELPLTDHAFDLARWLSHEAPLIEAIGRADFPARLLQSVFAAVPIDTAFIVAHVPARPPAMLEAGRVLPERREEIQRYLVGPYLLDPVRQACIEGRRGVLRLADIAPDGFQASEYYRSFYVSHGLADEVNILIDLAGAGGLALSMGRLAGHGAFAAEDLAKLRAIEPLVGAAARRHWGAVLVDGEGEGQALHRQLKRAFERFGEGCLTEREAEVARLILRGHSSKSVAHALAISTDTVGVHRKNIHAKLGISSQGELFSQFIASVTASGVA